jgi:hypothetical protein
MGTCKNFAACSCPICPEDPDRELRTWIPNEGRCTRKKYAYLPWVIRQRKISKATRGNPDRGAYTIAMLTPAYRVGKAIKGLDDVGPAEVEKWLKKHPVPTAEETEKRAAAMKKRQSSAIIRSKGAKGVKEPIPGYW